MLFNVIRQSRCCKAASSDKQLRRTRTTRTTRTGDHATKGDARGVRAVRDGDHSSDKRQKHRTRSTRTDRTIRTGDHAAVRFLHLFKFGLVVRGAIPEVRGRCETPSYSFCTEKKIGLQSVREGNILPNNTSSAVAGCDCHSVPKIRVLLAIG